MKGFVLAVLLFVAQQTYAQNWAEWTQQKKTQRKYLVQQIAGLKVYLDYAEKGYRVAQEGLTTVGKIKRGDFALHDGFFASLKAVNPKIASSTKAVVALARGVQIVREVKRTLEGLRRSGQFTPKEVAVFSGAFNDLLEQCEETVEGLIQLITSGHYEMNDAERVSRIESVAKAMEEHFVFCIEQSSGLGRLAVLRAAERIDIEYSKKLNGR